MKIKDERLILQGLKKIRIAFIIQTIGIIAVLIYIGILEGIWAAVGHPLWFVFILTLIVLGWLNFSNLVDVYDHVADRKSKRPYYWVVIISLIASLATGLIAKFGPDQSMNREALLASAVVFVCFFVSFTIGHFIVKRRLNDYED